MGVRISGGLSDCSFGEAESIRGRMKKKKVVKRMVFYMFTQAHAEQVAGEYKEVFPL